MVTPKTWDEFRESGCLWFVNTILHAFGWCIIVELSNGKVSRAYPARVSNRGFDDATNKKGYKNLAQYMRANAHTIAREADDNE